MFAGFSEDLTFSSDDYLSVLLYLHKEKGLLVATDAKRIFLYDPIGIYREIPVDSLVGEYRSLTKQFGGEVGPDKFKKAIFQFPDKPFSVPIGTIMELFSDEGRDCVNFKNGVYSFRDNKLHPHSKEFYFWSQINAEYDSEASCPTFDKFMRELTCTNVEVEKTLLEFVGYSMLAGYTLGHKFMILNGNGRNGKSAFLRTVGKIIGNISNVSLDNLSGYYLGTMNGKLLNTAEETKVKWIDEEILGNLKAISGGDALIINDKFQKPYRAALFPKMIFATNNIPQFGEQNDAIRLRMIVIDCLNSLDGKEDNTIEASMLQEANGIASKLLHHLKIAHKRKRIYVYKENTALVNQVLIDSSVYMRFIDEHIVADPDGELWHEDAFDRLKTVASDEDVYVNFHNLGKKIMQVFNPRKKRVFNNTKRRTVYLGIRLRRIDEFRDS